MRRSCLGVVALVVLATGLLGCSSGDGDDVSTGTSAPGSIEVGDPWCRATAAMVDNGACYMQIANDTDGSTVLVAASVPTSVAATTELHETTTGEGDGSTDTSAGGMEGGAGGTGSSTDMGAGMMGMRPVASIALPPHQTVSLEPGGYHVMLLELAEPLTAGGTVEITLSYEDGKSQTVQAEIRDL